MRLQKLTTDRKLDIRYQRKSLGASDCVDGFVEGTLCGCRAAVAAYNAFQRAIQVRLTQGDVVRFFPEDRARFCMMLSLESV